MNEEWSNDYKKKIDCSNPKGFSQKHVQVVKNDKQVKKQNQKQ